MLKFGFLLFLVVASTAFSIPADMALTNPDGSSMMAPTAKNLKDSINLEDYRPIDPSPRTKASIRPGPIQHGAPLNPYIPKPPSPDHPQGRG